MILYQKLLIFEEFEKHIQYSVHEEMDNRGEVSQILSGITFDRNNIF